MAIVVMACSSYMQNHLIMRKQVDDNAVLYTMIITKFVHHKPLDEEDSTENVEGSKLKVDRAMLLALVINSAHLVNKQEKISTSKAFIICTQITKRISLLLMIPAERMMTIRFVIKILVK